VMKAVGKLKTVKVKMGDKKAAGYDAKMSELDYPGTKGIAMPATGKQQVSGKKFSGTY
jgi:hypothetical protein